MGGKDKIARHFLLIILKDRRPDQYFVEPFCGGCNVTTKVEGLRIANDANPYVVALFKAVVKGWVPPDYVSFHDYQKICKCPGNYSPELVGFVGSGLSFAAKFMGTFARGNMGVSSTTRGDLIGRVKEDYGGGTKRSLLKAASNLKGVDFYSMDYRGLVVPKQSIIYCDPPYAGTEGYDKFTGQTFNHVEFWAWVRNVSMYHKVFVSEYNAPSDFKCVWKMERSENVSSTRLNGTKKIERLFVWKHSPHIK